MVGIIAQFAVATVLPAVVTFLLTKLREGKAKDMGYWPWQILCGLIFGVVAILGTEFGISTGTATMNVRDAAPLTAGLFFGGPAGIIAGLIGGIERWFAALWGRGEFTRIACTVATCFAGFYAALLRRFVFDDRKPSWPLAFATGIVAEVLHLQLVFITNPYDLARAVTVVRECTPPMVTCNGIAVALSALMTAQLAGELRQSRDGAPNISQVVQSHLLRVIVVGFILSAGFTLILQGGLTYSETNELLSLSLTDVQNDISHTSDANLLNITQVVAKEISSVEGVTQEQINTLLEVYGVSEIDVIDENGIIVASSNPEYIGYDMASGEQSAEFLVLLPGGSRTQMVQEYQPMSFDNSVWRKYAGVRVPGGFVQVAYDAQTFQHNLREHVYSSVRDRHVGQGGAMVVIAPNGTVAGTRSDLTLEKSDVNALVADSRSKPEGTTYTCEFQGEQYYASYGYVEGYQIFALRPVEEVNTTRDASVLSMAFMEVLVFAVLFIAVFRLIRNEVVMSIWDVNSTLGQITAGDLHAEVNVRNNAEFISLSHDINAMVAFLRQSIANEAARIDRELEYARNIQESALPRTFPPFPQINSFDIYASMDPAREVGGDFYDFFLVDDHTLGFLIADVSGKGIPASLFMMAAKTEISNYMSSGMDLAEAIQTANWHLCQGNETDMFVTVWAATLDYRTGKLTYVNAGHNPPLLRRDGNWEWLRQRGGLFLGAFGTAKYRSCTTTMGPGDQLLLYTDGVNEAFSADGEQYGDERLERFLSDHAVLHPHPLVDTLRADLARWAGEAEQSDDITMLALEYGVAPQATGSLTVKASLDNLDAVLDFVHSALRNRNCPIGAQNALDVAVEELFVNVCNYAYAGADEPGDCLVEYVFNTDPTALTVCLTDWGAPFDPLLHADPMAPGSIAEASIGGLGILMAKRMTDDMSYVRDDDKNVLAFVKSW